MQIYPAIDLIDGKCVRLKQGSFLDVTTYHDDPVEIARAFLDQGSTWLHVVDLDGAKNPANRQTDVIRQLASLPGLNVQTGGGIRSQGDATRLFDAGAKRVVLGSLAVQRPDEALAMLETFGVDRVVLALDVRQVENRYIVAVNGWQDQTSRNVLDALRVYAGFIRHVLCTDIGRDGVMAGPNLDLYRFLIGQESGLEVQASGGVSSLDDLVALRRLGVSGVIIGKALYEKRFTLSEALGDNAHAD